MDGSARTKRLKVIKHVQLHAYLHTYTGVFMRPVAFLVCMS